MTSKLSEIRAKVAAALQIEKLKPSKERNLWVQHGKSKTKTYTDYYVVNYPLKDDDEKNQWRWTHTHPTTKYFIKNGDGSLQWPVECRWTTGHNPDISYLEFRFTELKDAELFAKKFKKEVIKLKFSNGSGSYF